MSSLSDTGVHHSGRHMRYWNMKVVYTDEFAPGVMGKIQFGVAPEGRPKATVPPATFVPDGAGIPAKPLGAADPPPPPPELVPQAASAIAPAMATAPNFMPVRASL